MDFNQQRAKYLWLIGEIKNYSSDEDVVTKTNEWDNQKGVVGFPNTYSLYIEYKDFPNSSIDLVFHLDQDGNWSTVEIMNLDIAEKYRFKGLGRRLIKHAINIAKVARVKRIYGVALDKNNYSSVGFYKKCGFEISEHSTPRKFYMDIGT